MSSRAARANSRIRNKVKGGMGVLEAAHEVATASGGDVRTFVDGDTTYFEFPEDPRAYHPQSYLQVFPLDKRHGDGYYCHVLSDNGSKFTAWKKMRDIRAYCSQCGKELWCDRNGRADEQRRFQLPGTEIFVCVPCQRSLVIRALVGE